MKDKVVEGKGDELLSGLIYFPITPNRYLSLFSQGSAEDHFDYGDLHPAMNCFSQIKKAVLVLFAEQDENADRPVADIKKVFDKFAKSSQYESLIIRDTFHSFGGKEEEVARKIINWILHPDVKGSFPIR